MQAVHTWLASFTLHPDTMMPITAKQPRCTYGINYIKETYTSAWNTKGTMQCIKKGKKLANAQAAEAN